MVRSIAMALALLLGTASLAPAQECFGSDGDFSRWHVFYYQNPVPEKVACSITYYVNSALFKDTDRRRPLTHFYAALLRQDQQARADLFESMTRKAGQQERVFALEVFWTMNTQAGRDLVATAGQGWSSQKVRKKARKLEQEPVPDPLGTDVSGPDDLDNLWAIFYATGETAPVQKIIFAVSLKDEGKGEEVLLGQRAILSLENHVRGHARVQQIMESLVQETDGTTRKILTTILQQTE